MSSEKRTAPTERDEQEDPLSAAIRTVIRSELETTVAALAGAQTKPEFIDRHALAAELSTSVATVDRLCRAGMPFVRLGDARRFRLAEVAQWLDRRTSARSNAGGRRREQ